MKNYIFILLALSCGLPAKSQNSPADSPAAVINQLPEDTAKVRQLYELAKKVEKENNLKGRAGLLHAHALAEKLGAKEQLPGIEYALARNYIHGNSVDTGLIYIEASRRHAEELQDLKSLAKVYYLFQYVYKRQGDYEKASEYAFKSLETFEKMNDQQGVASALGKIGSLFYALEKWDDALNYTRKAYDLSKKEQFPDELAYAARLIADIFIQKIESEKALPYLDEALAIYRQKEDQLQVGMALDSRGNLLINLKKYEEALKNFQEGLSMVKQLDTDILLNTTYHNIGSTYNLMGKYAQAIPFLHKCIAVNTKTGTRMTQGKTYDQLSISYAGLGRYDSAFFYQKLSRAISDSLLTVENAQRMAELQTKYETEKKEATIAQQEVALKQERTRFWLITGILALALAGGALLFRLTRQLRQRNREKEFLIKEIHHRVKNNLQVLASLLSLQSRHIKDGAALDAVREGQNRVEAMGLIHQKLYMGDNLAAVGMRDYLHNLGDTLLDTFRLDDDRVKIIYHLEPLHLDVDTAIPLGLIINELLTNSLKYAFPDGRQGVVEISLWKNETGRLCLKVADNGVGKNGTAELKNSTSFGTNLVHILSKKLKGTPQVSNGDGYTTMIEFENFKMTEPA